MFQQKIAELKNTNIYQKITNFVLNNKYLNSFWIFLFILSIYTFNFNFLVTFVMFLMSVQVLFNYETLTDNSKLKNLLNLVKLWLFSSIALLCNYMFESFIDYTIINKIIQLVSTYFFIISSHKWFRENNMVYGNTSYKLYKSEDSVTIIDKILNIIFGLYANNYLLLHYMLLFICFLAEKLTLNTLNIKLNDKNKVSTEKTDDILDQIFDKTIAEADLPQNNLQEVIQNFYNDYDKNILTKNDTKDIDLLDEDI